MALCSPNCTIIPPRPPATSCNPQRRNGGINRLIFATCDFRLSKDFILSSRYWCSNVYSGKIVASSPLTAEKPKGSQTTKRFTSCAPETVTGYERVINFQDFSADNINYTDYDFWNAIQANPDKYQFGYLTCDGWFTGFIKEFTIEVSPVYEEVNTGSFMWDGSIKWTGLEMPEPIYINGLSEILAGNCESVPGFNPCGVIPSQIVASPSANLCQAGGSVTLRAPMWLNVDHYSWRLDGNPLPQFDGMRTITVNRAGSYTVTLRRNECPLLLEQTFSRLVTRTSGTPCFADPAYTATLLTNGKYSVTINVDTGGSGCQPDTSLIRYNIITGQGFESGWQVGSTIGEVPPGTHTLLIKNINTDCIESLEITL